MRALIYARYSSETQREASIADQVRQCREFILKQGWQDAGIHSDAALSGASRFRPGYQELLEAARCGATDVIVAEALDRLSRDQEDVAGLFKHLTFHGVRLITLAEGEISELHVGLKGTMNALFLKDLAEKTRRGLRGRIEAGCSGGGNSYGYDVISETGSNGEPVHGKRRINEAQAAVITRIFTDYANGRSPRSIAFDLNRDGIPGPRGEAWGASTINGNSTRGTGILNNELYIGRLVWNRLRYLKDPATGKRISRLNPAEDWIVKDVPHLAIVARDLWDRVKARQKSVTRATRPDVKDRPFWDRRRPRYLFSGLMKCGVCGANYTKISNNLFGCAAARNKGTCSNRINIRRDVLEATVLNGLKHHLLDPTLFHEFAQAFSEEVNRLRLAESAKSASENSELVSVERKIKRIVTAITEGVPALSLKDELLALEVRQTDLKVSIERAMSSQVEPPLHPNLADIYRRKIAEQQEALYEKSTRDEAFDLIRTLIDEIILTPQGDELTIALKGELAGILNLCSDSKKPGLLDRASAEQIKMVAGARNHLFRTRLKGVRNSL